MDGRTAEDVVLFHRTLEGVGDGAGVGDSFHNIDGEGSVETVILEMGLILIAPVAFEGTVFTVFPGPGTDIDLSVVKDHRIGSGFGEDKAGAFLFQFLFYLVVLAVT